MAFFFYLYQHCPKKRPDGLSVEEKAQIFIKKMIKIDIGLIDANLCLESWVYVSYLSNIPFYLRSDLLSVSRLMINEDEPN